MIPVGLTSLSTAAVTLWLVLATGNTRAESLEICQPQAFRWNDKCGNLSEISEKSALDRLRYLPLDESNSKWLTLGGEWRAQAERLSRPQFGIGNPRSYSTEGERFLVNADFVDKSGLRLFAQLSAASEKGRRPVERAFDRSAADIAQLFFDVPFELIGLENSLRLGRQEMDFSGNRLVSPRDASNLRRSFDSARLESRWGAFAVTEFYGRPVKNKPGAFDDAADPAERFWGATAGVDLPSPGKDAGSVELFYFVRTRDRAVFQDAVGFEQRRTLGARYAFVGRPWTAAAQAAVQWGQAAGKEIRAAALAGEVGYRLAALPWETTSGVTFGVASGDSKRGDLRLGTFDVLYPNLSYFTDAPLYFPGNSMDFNPSLRLKPVANITVQLGADFIFRITTDDAIYQPPGIPLVRGNGGGPRFGASLPYLKVTLTQDRNVEIVASVVDAKPGPYLRSFGAKTSHYGLLRATFRF